MRFARPEMLWMLLALPLVAALLWWTVRRRMAVLERYASATALRSLAPNHSRGRVIAKSALLLVAITFGILASARPQWGHEDRRLLSKGVDVMIAVDTSLSMMAQDYKPSRLDRAKQLLQNIIWALKGDRAGIIAFAGDAYIKCPLTLDYGMVSAALQSIDVSSVPVQGTDIGQAIKAAIRAFDASSQGEKILVLLTDGEDQGKDTAAALEKAKAQKIHIFTIGIGTTEGRPIPLPNGQYKQDKEGKIVNSRLDFKLLTDIASQTGGKAIKANASGFSELDVIMADLSQFQASNQEDRIHRVYTERFQWFLLPAILLLIWEALETAQIARNGRNRRVTA
ncbi:MAG: VWA domain-containing protein [Candidatus Sumerlaeaceae bacterium]|nr:VWA domain-containing protein [Candidatus Sumerlaeaceae bacterium]